MNRASQWSAARATQPSSAARPRVLWLAVADARGHLMRAQLMRGLLGKAGVEVDVVTTSDAGAAFLGAFDTPTTVVSRHFRVVYDERQNLARLRTEARSLGYLVSPGRCLRDLRWLERRARGAALVVNDSFHPALLVAAFGGLAGRLVQVYGTGMRRAVEGHFGDRGVYAAGVRTALERSYARIEHTLAEDAGTGTETGTGTGTGTDTGTVRLPPVIGVARRSRAEVRAALGVAPGQRLAVVYLNPHFRDPLLATAVEEALRGWVVHAVGEGFAGRAGWVARDAALADVVAAADLQVSAPGMGALGQARLVGTPLVALVTGQPEQRENLAFLRGELGARCRVVEVGGAGGALRARLADAIAALSTTAARPDPELGVRRVQAEWVRTFLELINRKEDRT